MMKRHEFEKEFLVTLGFVIAKGDMSADAITQMFIDLKEQYKDHLSKVIDEAMMDGTCNDSGDREKWER